jgi:hypothetical protein
VVNRNLKLDRSSSRRSFCKFVQLGRDGLSGVVSASAGDEEDGFGWRRWGNCCDADVFTYVPTCKESSSNTI